VNALANHPELVQRAVGGDAAALTLLLADLHESLRGMIASRIPQPFQGVLSAEDVLQEAYVLVFQHIRRFLAHDDDSFRNWVATIAANQLRNAIKAQCAVKRGGGTAAPNVAPPGLEQSCLSLLDLATDGGRTPSRSVARGEAAAVVQAALDDLPEHYRQALWLVYVEGRTAASAGKQMRRSERAIHGLCRRGLALLRERLGAADRLISYKG
jgi:RNA polymerase sigma-70 factor, ECF subfamily